MAAWLEALAAAERDSVPAVLVTVLTAKGSTPREAGAKMVVLADGLAGTIGGGNLEFQSEIAARGLLAAGAEGPSTRDFPLGPALGQCCGGHVTVLFEVLRPPRLYVGLFGAGHVGKALVRVLADLPCRVNWIDPRPEARQKAFEISFVFERADLDFIAARQQYDFPGMATVATRQQPGLERGKIPQKFQRDRRFPRSARRDVADADHRNG